MAKKQSEEREESMDNCGIIMPISTIDGCNDKHWADVNLIISEAIREAGFNPRIVSTSDDCSVIQKNIVQNIYDDKIVVCDVSGRNPNVMFELGMRLAFDKPTIIVIDDKTPYSFDTSVIDHISYPRNLDYYAIIEFKEKLTKKICATIESSKDSNYSTFLKQFAKIKIAKIEDKEGTAEEELLSKMDELNNKMNKIERNFNPPISASAFTDRIDTDLSRWNCLASSGVNYQSPIAQQSLGDIIAKNNIINDNMTK
ncbi:hypothetical protein [Prevotella sp.]|uniref:hypothetical protein n=1 Tax=Prevotella sp. TaxID=59823 RepID=UPI003DA2098E